MIPRFHLAFPVNDLKLAKAFYLEVFDCEIGRESLNWVDFNFFGHQIVAHLAPKECNILKTNKVDGDDIPSRHFGVILPWHEWEMICKRVYEKKIKFYIKPKIRFKGEKGEQGTFFIIDPSGNVLEIKSFKDDMMVFEK